jgi:hypothetical protein
MVLMPNMEEDIIPFAQLGLALGVDYAVIKHCSDDEVGSLGIDYKMYEAMFEKLKLAESDKTHDLLVGEGHEVVVHDISKAYAESIEIATPPMPRDESAMKPTFVVDDLEVVRTAAKATGGFLKPLKQAWRFRGFVVLDGWDPEGNIVQFKQVEAPEES